MNGSAIGRVDRKQSRHKPPAPFDYRSGIPPWVTAQVMVAFGAAMVGVAIALGG